MGSQGFWGLGLQALLIHSMKISIYLSWWSCDHTTVSEEELRKLKEESNVDSLRQELERERSRNSELEQKINDILRSRWLFWLKLYRYWMSWFWQTGQLVLLKPSLTSFCWSLHSLEDSPSQSPKVPPTQPPPPAVSSTGELQNLAHICAPCSRGIVEKGEKNGGNPSTCL